MNQTRKVLAAVFAVLGAWYCAIAVAVLIRLPSVTSRWIERSGDPDFRLDYGRFMTLSGIGATLILLLGWRTVVLGVATARGARPSWLLVALLAPPLHIVWWLYRVVGTGALGREAVAAERLTSGVEFGLICAGYLLLWGMSRRATSGPAGIAMHHTGVAGAARTGRG